VKLVFTTAAEAQAEEIDTWWREHREKAPDLFARELAEACELISSKPTLGTAYETSSGESVLRVRLPKTRHHLYFNVDAEDGTVIVLAIWGAPRREGPEM
jgi:plasmid stabilization system protein ParE